MPLWHELDPGERAVRVHLLGHPRQCRDVGVVPEPALDVRARPRRSGWISTSSVQTTAQPPSAFTPRITACAVGSRWPMPLQCGTWKKRFRAVTGPIGTGSNRMS